MPGKALIPHSHQCSSERRCVVVRNGSYRRKSDGVRVQRFRCKGCHDHFSEASSDICYGQKKRQVNKSVFSLLVSNVSQRRSAMVLGINRKTVVRKLVFLGGWALQKLPETNLLYPKVSVMEFDDLETFEHSKCKPLSVTLSVEYKSRRILGFRVSSMPAKGKLATISRKRYGIRADDRKSGRRALLQELQSMVNPEALIKSDMNPHYTEDVREFFPNAEHEVFKGRRGCVVGQGELKRGGYDPLFSLNHTCAMFRENINRLKRRTWCTTKRPDRLHLHIAMYAIFHNTVLLKKKSYRKYLNPKMAQMLDMCPAIALT